MGRKKYQRGQLTSFSRLAYPCNQANEKKKINMSISHGQVPIILKEATVRLLLKKPSLDIDVLARYRPVSNLAQLSKTL